MSMRVSRLAGFSSAFSATRFGSSALAAVALSSTASSVKVWTTTSTGVRRLASVATQPGLDRSAHERHSIPTLPAPLTQESLRPQAEQVEELLRSGIGGSGVWVERLQGVKNDLDTSRARRRRIAGKSADLGTSLHEVVGDAMSGARDVVTSLLQDPISDSIASREALLARHTDTDRSQLVIGWV